MRDDLLAAARRVLETSGYAGLTIRAVLAEADVAPGTLYAYFKGKDELLAELARRVMAEVLAGVAAESSTPPDEALAGLLANAFLVPNLGVSLLTDMRGRSGDAAHTTTIREFNAALVSGTRPLIERAVAGGQVRCDDVDALVELLDIVWDGLTRRAAGDTFVTSYERIGAVMLGLLQAGIGLPATDAATDNDGWTRPE
jgi:AcrR family transcriptional regulator